MTTTIAFIVISLVLTGVQYWQREKHLALILHKIDERNDQEAQEQVKRLYGKPDRRKQ